MFNTKRKQLFEISEPESGFVAVGLKRGLKKSAKTKSLGNNAVKYTTTGNDFLDQFGKITNYKQPRSFQEASNDMSLLWSQDKQKALALAFYIRLITRTIALPTGDKTKTTQRGQGLKHEGILRMLWLAVNHPATFWKNIPLFISIGSWKDIIYLLSFDLQYNGWEGRLLDWGILGKFILAGLENPNQSELIKKYLPQIKSNRQCRTIEAQADNLIGKWVCSLLFGKKENSYNYRQYRKLKSSGTAHEWQKLISQSRLLQINFDSIHGRALAQIVSGKFLKNNGLEAGYQKWLESKPVAKYTGFVYELMAKVKKNTTNIQLKPYQAMTINKQFEGLIEVAKKGMKPGDSGLLAIVDTSGSMQSDVAGAKVSSYDVAKSMALYFSYLLDGPFKGVFAEFSNETILKKWKGTTPVEKLQNEGSSINGGTNFQSISVEFVKILKYGVEEKLFPSGILCVSDGCFNNTGNNKTNVKTLKKALLDGGFSEHYVKNFKIVLWDIPNGYYGSSQTAFEDFSDTPNLFHLSGLDGSAIAFLTGVEGQKKEPKTSEELFEAAMNQEVLNLIEL